MSTAVSGLYTKSIHRDCTANTTPLPLGLVTAQLFIMATSDTLNSREMQDTQHSETMQVVVRVRPLSASEQARGDAVAVNTTSDTTLTLAGSAASQQQRAWAFDRVFDSTTSNDEIYRGAVQHLVQSAMHGFNACVFAYGQTASGKTHTIKAITQAAAADIFAHVSASNDREWLIRASAIEIYNEEARDMLRDDGAQEPLKPRPDKKRGTVFEGLQEEGVHSAQHLLRLLKSVDFRRQVGVSFPGGGRSCIQRGWCGAEVLLSCNWPLPLTTGSGNQDE